MSPRSEELVAQAREHLAAAHATLRSGFGPATPLRLGVDYEALRVPPSDAEAVVELAGHFVSAIEALYPD